MRALSAVPVPPRGRDSLTLFELENVSYSRGGAEVLRGVNAVIEPGATALLGPSGSGKSTLLRTINRLEPIDSGRIEVDGIALPEEGRALARLRADVGMVFQSFNLFAHKSVLDNVTLGPTKVRGLRKADAKKRAKPGNSPSVPNGKRPTALIGISSSMIPTAASSASSTISIIFMPPSRLFIKSISTGTASNGSTPMTPTTVSSLSSAGAKTLKTSSSPS